jgi:hypothetical protein
MTAPHSNAVADALPVALAAGTRGAADELLTEDVHWGGEHGGNEGRTRVEEADHYAGLLAAGVRLPIADIRELDPPPTVELLYFDGCPNYEAFRPHLRQLLAHHYPTVPISMIRIDGEDDAQQHRFLGSPTLRVNGRDVDPTAAGRDAYGLQCRVYATPAGMAGVPTDQWILDALIGNPADAAAVDAVHTGDIAGLE